MFKKYHAQYSNKPNPNKSTIDRTNEIGNPFFLSSEPHFEQFLHSIPPKEAFLYFPRGEEIIYFHKNPKRNLRRIFFNVQYTEKEIDSLTKLNELKQSSNIEYTDYWTEGDCLRFLYAYSFDVKKTLRDTVRHLDWRRQTFPINFGVSDNIFKILNSGLCYCNGRDHQFRPILIFQPLVYINHEHDYPYEDWVNAIVYFCEYVCSYMFIPGQIENWISIMNLRNINVIALPNGFKKIMTLMGENYRARLYRSYLYGLSGFLRGLYKIVCKFLDPVTVRKFVLVSDSHLDVACEIIRKENLERKFGGVQEDINFSEEGCFPPKYMGEKCILDEENENDILVSKEEYIERYRNGELDTVSPYILEEMENNKEDEESIIEKSKEDNSKFGIVGDIDYIFKNDNLNNKNENNKLIFDGKEKCKDIKGKKWINFSLESPYMKKEFDRGKDNYNKNRRLMCKINNRNFDIMKKFIENKNKIIK